MSKVSIWTNDNYSLMFGDESLVSMNVSVEITKKGVEKGQEQFDLKVLKCQVSTTEVFLWFVLRLLTAEQLNTVSGLLVGRLVEEITPSLYSLFYHGTIQP